MSIRRLVLTPFVALVGVSALLSGATTQMGINEVRPGMIGVGRTVFDGTRVEEFKAHIIGVLENVIGTHRNLILAKLEGGPLANTGVIAGMSGSPVYIDGKLVGAVSYALGSFSKEPIAGITPIAEMTDSTSFNEIRPPGSKVKVEYPFTPITLLIPLSCTSPARSANGRFQLSALRNAAVSPSLVSGYSTLTFAPGGRTSEKVVESVISAIGVMPAIGSLEKLPSA